MQNKIEWVAFARKVGEDNYRPSLLMVSVGNREIIGEVSEVSELSSSDGMVWRAKYQGRRLGDYLGQDYAKAALESWYLSSTPK